MAEEQRRPRKAPFHEAVATAGMTPEELEKYRNDLEKQLGLTEESDKEQSSRVQKRDREVALGDVETESRKKDVEIDDSGDSEDGSGTTEELGTVSSGPSEAKQLKDYLAGQRHRPTYPLGRKAHRDLYAKVMAGPNPTPETLEAHGKDWDAMRDVDKYNWQNGIGKQPTQEAIKAATPKVNTSNPAMIPFRAREKARGLAFPTPEHRQAFEQSGVLTKQEKDPNTGDWSKEPENDWHKTWLTGITSDERAGRLALPNDASFHEAMARHIDDVESRSTEVSTPNVNMAQFPDTASSHLELARQSLAKSAMAHSLGMKDHAFRFMAEASNHANMASTTIHQDRKAAGLPTIGDPMSDLTRTSVGPTSILTGYRKAIKL